MKDKTGNVKTERQWLTLTPTLIPNPDPNLNPSFVVSSFVVTPSLTMDTTC